MCSSKPCLQHRLLTKPAMVAHAFSPNREAEAGKSGAVVHSQVACGESSMPLPVLLPAGPSLMLPAGLPWRSTGLVGVASCQLATQPNTGRGRKCPRPLESSETRTSWGPNRGLPEREVSSQRAGLQARTDWAGETPSGQMSPLPWSIEQTSWSLILFSEWLPFLPEVFTPCLNRYGL